MSSQPIPICPSIFQLETTVLDNTIVYKINVYLPTNLP